MSAVKPKRLVFRRRAGGLPRALVSVVAFAVVLAAGLAVHSPAWKTMLHTLLAVLGLVVVPVLVLLALLGRPRVTIDLAAEEVENRSGVLFWQRRECWPLREFTHLALSLRRRRGKTALWLVGPGDLQLELSSQWGEPTAWRDAVRLSTALGLPVMDRTGAPPVEVSADALRVPLAKGLTGRSDAFSRLIGSPAPDGVNVEALPGGGVSFVLRPRPASAPLVWERVALGIASAGVIVVWIVLLRGIAQGLWEGSWAMHALTVSLVAVGAWWAAVLTRMRPVKITVANRKVTVSQRPRRTILFPESLPTAEVTSVIARSAGGLAIVSPAKTILLDRSALSDALGLSEEEVTWLKEALTSAIATLGRDPVEAPVMSEQAAC